MGQSWEIKRPQSVEIRHFMMRHRNSWFFNQDKRMGVSCSSAMHSMLLEAAFHVVPPSCIKYGPRKIVCLRFSETSKWIPVDSQLLLDDLR